MVGSWREIIDVVLSYITKGKGTMAYRMLAINPMQITEQDVLDILEDAYA